MSNTGLLYGVTCADQSGVGTVTWSSPANAQGNNTVDATKATANLVGTLTSHYLTASFTTGLGASDTINGVVVAVRRYSTLNDSDAPQDNVVKLIKNGTIGGNNKGVATSWPQSGAWSSDYGGTTDTWGLSFIGTDTIGVALSVAAQDPNDSAFVTAFRITVYYTTSTGVPGYIEFFQMLRK